MKRCVIATEHLRLSAGPTRKTTTPLLPVSSEYCHDRQVDTLTTESQPKDIGDEADVAPASGIWRGVGVWGGRRRQVPPRDASWVTGRAVRVLSAMEARRAARFIQLLTLGGVVSPHKSSGLHQLSKRIEGKRDAPKHKRTCSCVLFKTTTG